MRLIAVGRIGAGPEAVLFARYNGRLRPGLVVTEVVEGRGAPAVIKRREGEVLLAALSAGAFVVALDLGGVSLGSEVFAARLQGWLEAGKKLHFVIGGAEGFSAEFLARADVVLSLGPLTWPHMLVRVMLVEQLFRARSIAANHPYHRGSRPC